MELLYLEGVLSKLFPPIFFSSDPKCLALDPFGKFQTCLTTSMEFFGMSCQVALDCAFLRRSKASENYFELLQWFDTGEEGF